MHTLLYKTLLSCLISKDSSIAEVLQQNHNNYICFVSQAHFGDRLEIYIFFLPCYKLSKYIMPATSVKLASELWELTFSAGKPKLTPGEVPSFQEF